MKTCSVEGCGRRLEADGLCGMHRGRLKRNGHLGLARRQNGTGTIGPYLKFSRNYEGFYEHRLIAERALGKPLPEGVEVHHVDGNKTNNSPTNLVICPSSAYHHLIERRTRAFEACGHADWMKCKVCKQYDDPKNNMHVKGRKAYHRDCDNRRDRGIRLVKRWSNEAKRLLQEANRSVTIGQFKALERRLETLEREITELKLKKRAKI